MEEICPLHEFDSTREAFIEPSKRNNVYLEEEIAESCVFTFSNDLINQLSQHENVRKVGYIKTPNATTDIYILKNEGKLITFLQIPVGAAAAVIRLELLIALGAKKIIVFGSAGVLNHEISAGNILIPVSAIRDEGTSYHYLAPSREVEMDEEIVKTISEVLDKRKIKFQRCKTWTTDAVFRETAKKVFKRKSEGCVTVDMECSALLSVAKFRGVKFGQILYAQDSLGGIEWDSREEWRNEHSVSAVEKIFFLSAEIAANI